MIQVREFQTVRLRDEGAGEIHEIPWHLRSIAGSSAALLYLFDIGVASPTRSIKESWIRQKATRWDSQPQAREHLPAFSFIFLCHRTLSTLASASTFRIGVRAHNGNPLSS